MIVFSKKKIIHRKIIDFILQDAPCLVLFFHFFLSYFLPRLSFKVVSLANFSSFCFFGVFREFMVILFKICVPFMIILHGKENKVYGGREMDRKIDLTNFMYARLYDASKDMATNKILFLYSIDWFDQRMFYYFSSFFTRKIPRIWW